MPYQPAADLWIDMDLAGEPDAGSYTRSLELDRALSFTRFAVNGTLFEREVFASAVDGVIVVRIACLAPGRADSAPCPDLGSGRFDASASGECASLSPVAIDPRKRSLVP